MARALLLRSRMRLRFFSALLFFAAVGCSSSSSPPQSFSDDIDASTADADIVDAAPACAGPTPTQTSDACQQCQDTKCCVSATAEQTKPDEWTKSVGEICREDNCSAECGTAASKCGNITPSPASCLAALDAACCDQVAACGNSDQCLALVYLCIDDQNCDPSAACFKDCRAQYPDGAKIFDVMNACYSKVNCG
jgi:hypothetical protein